MSSMQAPFFSAGASYQSRYGIACSAGLNPGSFTSWVVAAICWGWKFGIFPSGQSGIRSPANASTAASNP